MNNNLSPKPLAEYLGKEKSRSSSNNKRMRKGMSRKMDSLLTILGSIVCIILVVVCIFLFMGVISSGAESLKNSYDASYMAEKDETYKTIYQVFFDNAEEKYHVSNRVSITIGNMKEQEKLEVLKVSDVEFVIEGKDDNSGNMTSWLEVPGEGVYVVDLAAGEYIIDDERAHVLVRVPYPELVNIKIDYSNVKKLLFRDDIFNGSYKEGEELAMKQLGQGDVLIKKEFQSNQGYYVTAQKSAKTSIINLVQQLNPNVENLNVDVEFY